MTAEILRHRLLGLALVDFPAQRASLFDPASSRTDPSLVSLAAYLRWEHEVDAALRSPSPSPSPASPNEASSTLATEARWKRKWWQLDEEMKSLETEIAHLEDEQRRFEAECARVAEDAEMRDVQIDAEVDAALVTEKNKTTLETEEEEDDDDWELFRLFELECAICLSFVSMEDEAFHLVGCGHGFCAGCLAEYWTSLVDEGAVEGLICPHVGCDCPASVLDLTRLLPARTMERFLTLTLSRALDRMDDIVYCPQPHCGAAGWIHDEADLHQACPACHLCFCIKCLSPSANCTCVDDSDGSSASSAASSSSSNEAERKSLNERKKLLAVGLMESYTLLSRTTKLCPMCWFPIEKNGGCDHMYCTLCRTSFNWSAAQPPQVSKNGIAANRRRSGRFGRRHFFRNILYDAFRLPFTRRQSPADVLAFCPHCHFRHRKDSPDNHVECGRCRRKFCVLCGAPTAGSTKHFLGVDACPQHTPLPNPADFEAA